MTLLERIQEDLKAAMKARDERKVSTLRMLKAAAGNTAIQKQKGTLEDGEVLEVIQRMIKQHQESVEAFTKVGRSEAAEKEAKEAEILKGYMPAAMEEAELKALIGQTIQELKVSGPAAMGQVMKALMPKVKGRADGKLVSQLVQQLLSGAP